LKAKRLFLGCSVCAVVSCPLWPALAAGQVQFAEVTAKAGISFYHRNGAKGEKEPPLYDLSLAVDREYMVP
jgi:hypothetical protein